MKLQSFYARCRPDSVEESKTRSSANKGVGRNAFNISGLISSSPAAFPDFNRPIATATSLAVKTFSSPKHIDLCVSSLVAFTGFRSSSKYSLHLDRISFLSLRMLPEGSLMEEQEFDLLPCKRRTVC